MISFRRINRYGLARPVIFVVFHVETKFETQQNPVLKDSRMANSSRKVGELLQEIENAVPANRQPSCPCSVSFAGTRIAETEAEYLFRL